MIIVKISGGLGNQLFQYNFGQYLSSRLNTIVKYHPQTNIQINNFTVRDLLLHDFEIKLDIATESEINIFLYKQLLCIVPYKVFRKSVQTLSFLSSHLYVEKKNLQLINPQSVRDNCYYDGYWQSLEYMHSSPKFNLNAINVLKITKLINDIINCNSVSIHVRRGDYLTVKKNENIFYSCDKEYYINSIRYMKKKLKNPVFFIFSDDENWIKANFIGDEFNIVTGNTPSEDMYLMSICKHNIIANSTFSWWGAWLNNSTNKIIIAPHNWYKGTLNSSIKTLIPNSWVLM
jgi:hypothetical protein